MAMLLMVRLVVPTLVRVTVFAALVVPAATVPKFQLAGDSFTPGLLLRLKLAVTDLAPFIVSLQVPVPVQAPLQPAKVDPAAGVAVSVTTSPIDALAEQTLGQLIPVGLLVTMPLPVPDNAIVSGKVVLA
jgi:hypothetical protein